MIRTARELLLNINAGRTVAMLLGFILLSGCGGVSDQPYPESEGHTPAEIKNRADNSEEHPKVPAMVPAERARLVSVTDGDTVKVGLSNGSRANVRLIGIDTPETYPEVECGGPEATSNLRQMIGHGDTLNLFVDPTQDDVDRYGRLLRYIFTGSGVDVGLDQIGTGHASVYVYNNNPFVALDSYQDAEDAARSSNGGIWGAC